MATMKAKEKELKDEKEAERQVRRLLLAWWLSMRAVLTLSAEADTKHSR